MTQASILRFVVSKSVLLVACEILIVAFQLSKTTEMNIYNLILSFKNFFHILLFLNFFLNWCKPFVHASNVSSAAYVITFTQGSVRDQDWKNFQSSGRSRIVESRNSASHKSGSRSQSRIPDLRIWSLSNSPESRKFWIWGPFPVLDFFMGPGPRPRFREPEPWCLPLLTTGMAHFWTSGVGCIK